MTKEERREFNKQYYEKHKDQIKDYKKKKYEKNNKEYYKKYIKDHYKKHLFLNRIFRYFTREFSRYISLENYLTIMKLEDESLKRSLMTRLGKGYILEEEAVALSGMTFTEEDRKILNEYFKTSYKH